MARKISIGHELELIFPHMNFPGAKSSMYEPLDIATPEFCTWIARNLSCSSYQWIGLDRDESDITTNVVKPEHDIDPINFVEDQYAGVELITPPLNLPAAEAIRKDIEAKIYGDVLSMRYMDTSSRGYGWHINLDIDGKKPDMLDFFLHAPEMAILVETQRSEIWGCRTLKKSMLSNILDDRVDGLDDPITESALRDRLSSLKPFGKEHAANFQRDGYVELRHYAAYDFLDGEGLEEIVDRYCLLADLTAMRDHAIEELKRSINVLDGLRQSFDDRLSLSGEYRSTWFGERTQDIHLDGKPLCIYRPEIERSSDSSPLFTGRDEAKMLIRSSRGFEGLATGNQMARNVAVEIIVTAYEFATALSEEDVTQYMGDRYLPEAFRDLVLEVQTLLEADDLLDPNRDVACLEVDCDEESDFEW